jgi:beta-galactosidase/beta-glucuronidase
MNLKKSFFILLFSAFAVSSIFAEPLPRPEYPRPQFERQAWVNLNGIWTYTFDFGNSGHDRDFQNSKGFTGKITVPFCPESKLSGVEYKDFINSMWYQRFLTIPAEWKGKNIVLHFGAVDYQSELYIDGKMVGRHSGGTSSFEFDITPYISTGQTHNLVLFVNDELRTGKQMGGKQCPRYYSEGCSYTRTTGIWQTVWMEAVAPSGLRSVQVITDLDEKQVVVHPVFYAESNAGTLKVTLKDNGKIVAQKSVRTCNSSVCILPVPKVKPWSPESPFLYDLVYEVLDKDNKTIDVVNSYVGIRKVHIEGDRYFLNNKPYFLRLVLDQGFYPEGVWTAPTDADLKKDIELSMAAGFNGARLHQKVFEERFHYWADKLGYLTWGESSSWGVDYNNVEAIRNFVPEWTENVLRDRNHPSIITWTPLNETGGNDQTYPRFVEDLYRVTKAIDPTRPINDASGWCHVLTDIWSYHLYYGPDVLDKLLSNGPDNKAFYDEHYEYSKYQGQPFMLDEFGGIRKWQEDGKDAWGYGDTPKNADEFYKRLEGEVDAILKYGYISGFCYTQLTDVEQEQNGLYLYDRSTKFDMNRIKAIFSKPANAYLSPKK